MLAEIEAYESFERFPIIVSNKLKDERLPNEKVEQGKARIFSVCPFPYLIYVRKWLLGFIVYFKQHFLETEVAAGIDPNSRTWHDLAAHLTNGFTSLLSEDADYGGFEYCVPSNVSSAPYTVFKRMTNEIELIRQIENISMYNQKTVNIVADLWYYRHVGNTSGQPITLHYNCILNSLLLRCAFLQYYVTKGHDITEASQIVKTNFKMTTFGDDNIFTMLKRDPNFFSSISAIFASWDIEFTTASKTKDFTDVKVLYDTTYLKRRFIPNITKDTVVGPLDPRTIYEMTRWMTKQDEPDHVVMEANLRSAYTESFFHGKVFFETFDKYVKMYAQRYCPKIRLFFEYNHMVAQFGYNPEPLFKTPEYLEVLSTFERDITLVS